jgi:hypothetical protein
MIANTLNQRPLALNSVSGDDISIITPNSLLLGRSHNDNPGAWLDFNDKLSAKASMIQSVHKQFWNVWSKTCLPALIYRKKWNVDVRNLEAGDVVMVMEDCILANHYRLARVSQVYPGRDGKVRTVDLRLLRYKSTEPPGFPIYTGGSSVILKRSVQKLVLLVPVKDME